MCPPSLSACSSRACLGGLTLCCLLGSGCAAVQPWERGIHSRACMRPEPDPLGQRIEAHVHEYREGSLGAEATSGGGCGCN
ncbi:MAG: DUF4266 domain-containing protein [Deltaproteobacteria bacterium]|nr:DUF4266 domain-containing protein [Deltaproteobacteria bacterium]